MDYEEYMRNVLGYNQVPNNIYANNYNDYYYDTQYVGAIQVNQDRLTDMYPEIYRIIYPMVCRVCTQNGHRDLNKETIESMTDEIYRNIEEVEPQATTTSTATSQIQRMPLKNGDVRNPNAKEPEVRNETRQNNFILRDLIKILIIRELLNNNNRPPQMPRPPRPMRPPYDQRPPWRPY